MPAVKANQIPNLSAFLESASLRFFSGPWKRVSDNDAHCQEAATSDHSIRSALFPVPNSLPAPVSFSDLSLFPRINSYPYFISPFQLRVCQTKAFFIMLGILVGILGACPEESATSSPFTKKHSCAWWRQQGDIPLGELRIRRKINKRSQERACPRCLDINLAKKQCLSLSGLPQFFAIPLLFEISRFQTKIFMVLWELVLFLSFYG